MRKSLRAVAVSALALNISGCLSLDDVGYRASLVNRSANRYANESILMNVIRAKNFEPLNFSSLSKFTGHDDFGVALPAINAFPASSLSLAFGGTTLNATIRNDFDVNTLDDPDSYKALLEPIDPQYIDLFLRQGYSRELIFALFIERVRERDGSNEILYENVPDKSSFTDAFGKVETLVAAGLTVRSIYDAKDKRKVAVPCFDISEPPPPFRPDPYKGYGPRCAGIRLGSAKSLVDDRGRSFTLQTRSVYGLYQFLGALLRTKTDLYRISSPETGDAALFQVSNNRTDCFVETIYNDEYACVSNAANNTKIIFSLVRQLLNVLTKPSTTSATPTVRAIL